MYPKESRAICAKTNDLNLDKPEDTQHLKVVRMVFQNKNAESRPISEMDYYVAFPPSAWTEMSVYIKTLQELAAMKCDR